MNKNSIEETRKTIATQNEVRLCTTQSAKAKECCICHSSHPLRLREVEFLQGHSFSSQTICKDCFDRIKTLKKEDISWLDEAQARHQPFREEIHKRSLITANSGGTAWKDFCDELSVEYPEFCHYWNEFEAGMFTLDNGLEDDVLEGVLNRTVRKGVCPSKKQMTFFNSRCSHYLEKKRKGEELIKIEDTHQSGNEVQEKITFLQNHPKYLNSANKEFLDSIVKFYAQRGYVTEKQFWSLKRIADRIALNS